MLSQFSCFIIFTRNLIKEYNKMEDILDMSSVDYSVVDDSSIQPDDFIHDASNETIINPAQAKNHKSITENLQEACVTIKGKLNEVSQNSDDGVTCFVLMG